MAGVGLVGLVGHMGLVDLIIQKFSVMPPSSMVVFNLQLLLGTSLQICIFEGINKSTILPQLICPTFLNARLPSVAF